MKILVQDDVGIHMMTIKSRISELLTCDYMVNPESKLQSIEQIIITCEHDTKTLVEHNYSRKNLNNRFKHELIYFMNNA